MDLCILEIKEDWEVTEKRKRLKAVETADAALSAKQNELATFLSEHFAMTTTGLQVHWRAEDTLNADYLWVHRQRLLQEISAAHDAFQRALKSYSELS